MEQIHTYIYEIKKGTKPAALVTLSAEDAAKASEKIKKAGLSIVVQHLKNGKANVFFGDYAPIEVIKTLIHKPLNEFSPCEDFVLGIILGYSREKQCERFVQLNRSTKVA